MGTRISSWLFVYKFNLRNQNLFGLHSNSTGCFFKNSAGYHLPSVFSLYLCLLLPMWNFLEFPRVTLDIWIVTLFNSIKNSHEIMALRSEKFKFIARGIFFWNWIFVICVLIIISMMLGSLLVQNFELMPKLKIGMPLTTILYIKIKVCRKCIMRIPTYAILQRGFSTACCSISTEAASHKRYARSDDWKIPK